MRKHPRHRLRAHTTPAARPVTADDYDCSCGSGIWIDVSQAVCIDSNRTIGRAY